MMKYEQTGTQGFSLIEINLAIFVVALGMLTLFSLFPAGLRQAETAHENTQEALFGSDVLATLRAEAMDLDAAEWVALDPATTFSYPAGGGIETVEYPSGEDLWMRYVLALDQRTDHSWGVFLWCRSGQYGTTDVADFQNRATVFYTELFYSGMQ